MDELEQSVRRAGRARAALAVLGIVGLVAVVTVGAVLVGQYADPAKSSARLEDQSSESPGATPTLKPGAEAPNPDCGHGAGLVNVFTAAPAPIDDESLAQQRAVIDRIRARDWEGFKITGAEPTHLGVVALVDDHWKEAKSALEAEGVRLVALTAPELGNVHEQAMNFLQELLEPAVADIDHIRHSVPGYGETAVWQEAGAIVVNWKAPIPTQILAMAGVRDDGVNVIIQPVRYSFDELSAAMDRVSAALQHHRVDAKWSTSFACDDGSGIVVGIQPDSLGSRKAALESQLAEIAQTPVHVVAEQAPTPL